jgi:hypothetical protein
MSNFGVSDALGDGWNITVVGNTPCAVDSPTPSTIATESSGSLVATWSTTGFSASSLTLSAPTTLKVLPASEVYRVDIVWTLGTGRNYSFLNSFK